MLNAFSSCLLVEYSEQAEFHPPLTRNLGSKYLKANYWIPLTATAESVEVLIDDPHSFEKLEDIRRHIDASERGDDPNEAIASLSNILGQLEEEEEVAVGNYGLSIREAELETIVDKFVQSSKTKTGAGATGLGLSISREILAAHHGYLWAQNKPEGGVRSLFSLLLAEPEDALIYTSRFPALNRSRRPASTCATGAMGSSFSNRIFRIAVIGVASSIPTMPHNMPHTIRAMRITIG